MILTLEQYRDYLLQMQELAKQKAQDAITRMKTVRKPPRKRLVNKTFKP